MNPVFSPDKVSIIPIENRKGHFEKKSEHPPKLMPCCYFFCMHPQAGKQ